MGNLLGKSTSSWTKIVFIFFAFPHMVIIGALNMQSKAYASVRG